MRGVTDMYDAQAQQKGRQGRLKIFFGYAAGVGKTYAMLEAAHLAQKQGVDVVVGYIERHTRPDTLALLEGLPAMRYSVVTTIARLTNEFGSNCVDEVPFIRPLSVT